MYLSMYGLFLIGQQVYRGSHQTKGVTMVPKRALNITSCEIARLLQLTQNAVIPISYHVQRKVFTITFLNFSV